MSKKHRKIDDDPRQMTIFDFLQSAAIQVRKSPQQPSPTPTITPVTTPQPATECGSMAVTERMREALRVAMKNSPRSRHQIAGEISHLVNETVSKEVVDSWVRQSDELNGRNTRHIPAEYLPAFCLVTGDNTPIQIMGEVVGLFVLPGPEALRAEIQRLDEEASRIAAEKRKRKLFLQEMEK